MDNNMSEKFRIYPPISEAITAYDRQCFKLYLMLIDAENDGERWEDAHERIFGLETGVDLQIAELQYHSHLERARWMTIDGYKQLLKCPYL